MTLKRLVAISFNNTMFRECVFEGLEETGLPSFQTLVPFSCGEDGLLQPRTVSGEAWDRPQQSFTLVQGGCKKLPPQNQRLSCSLPTGGSGLLVLIQALPQISCVT